jgi:superfamily II DNA or RNA helicase
VELFDYQQVAVDAVREEYRAGARAVVLQMTTGAGKTTSATKLTEATINRGGRVWFVAHRRELIKQAHARMVAQGIRAGVVMADHEPDYDAPCQVISVDTLNARDASALLDPTLVITDECHHAPSPKYDELFERTARARHLGLSATPWRLDGMGLNERYDALVEGPKPSELVAMGRLVPYELWSGPAPKLAAVPSRAGDFVRGELAEASAKIVGDVVATYKKTCDGARMIAFAVNRTHSAQLVDKFNAAGVPAWSIDFRTKQAERDATLLGFAEGTIKVLVNVEIITEGYDVPACDGTILARATESESLYLQMVGRGGRASPGKTKSIVLDHGFNVFRHGDPLEYRTLSLQGRARRDRQESETEGAGLRLCDACLRVYPQHRTECVHCGEEYKPPPPKVDTRLELSQVGAGDLHRDRVQVRRARFWQLDANGKRAGKNPWVACYIYKKEFGAYPHEDNIFMSHQERVKYWGGRKR